MLRDPPHYLRALKTTTTPRRLAWLACKGHVVKVRGRYEMRFMAGALGTTHWTSKKGTRKDTLTTYDDTADLWAEVDRYCVAGRKLVMFGYDMAEQMRVSGMFTHLPARGWSIDKIIMDTTAAWCLWRNGDRSLMLCDLKSWVPVSWEKIIGDIDGGRAAKSIVHAGPYRNADVCMIRAAYIRAAVLQLLEWIEGENLGPFRPTGSGQSYSAYRRRFIASRILVHDDETRLRAERSAMHTGRVEAWRHGVLRDGPYLEYDLRAAYATIARDCDVPTIARQERQRIAPARLADMIETRAVLAEVTVETEVPCVPVTVGKRTMWPVGRFQTTLWDPELRLALQHCSKVEVHRAYSYDRDRALGAFAEYVLDNMAGQTQVYGLLPQRALKHWSRCLVGRFGLRYRSWHKFGEQDPPDVRLVDYYDIDQDERTTMLLAGSQRLLLGDLEESPESLPQIPGWIMSECRRRLFNMMLYADDGLVYVDTDSVIVQGSRWSAAVPGADIQTSSGVWVHKGTYNRMIVYGPRNLSVNDSRRVAGVPLAAQQTATLEFEGEVQRSVKEAMRDGNLDLVVSLPRTFHITAQDHRRQHNGDGSTSPFRLDME